MPTTAQEAKILKFPQIKFNKKQKKREYFQHKICHTQILGSATIIKQQFTWMKSRKLVFYLTSFSVMES